MGQVLHGCATTTHAVRTAIQRSKAPLKELAARYGLHRRLLAIVRDDEVCRRLMTTPGVGPVVALTYRATVDVPARFRKSKAVGAVFGLTWQGPENRPQQQHENCAPSDS